jgi:hypothetical protein
MFIELKELQSGEVSHFNSDDFRRIQQVILSHGDGVCITFKDGGEILFDESYTEVMAKLKK